MSIITFWNDNREQSGRTLTSVAVATRMAIERNSKVLLISTSVNDSTMKNCFFSEQKKNSNMFGTKDIGIGVETGIEGLFKLISSNKLDASVITDYTKVVFKNRLEVILGPFGIENAAQAEKIEYLKRFEQCYFDLIKIANQYYDIVIVDLDKMLTNKTKEDILNMSDVNVYVLSQKLESINKYSELKEKNKEFLKTRCVPVIGKYIGKYKYNSKNIARYLKEKKELDVLPLNLLFMEASEEYCVPDLLLKLKNVKDETDENYIFMKNLLNLTNNIMKKLQDMQMRTR